MWPRIAELLLGIWLGLTPVIFARTEALESFVLRDVAAGAAVVVLSVVALWRRAEWAHLITAGLALGLGLAAYFGSPRPGPPAAQNEIAVAFVLLLFAIVPNEATRPPRPWRIEETPRREGSR